MSHFFRLISFYEFKASQGYTVKPYLKTQNKRERERERVRKRDKKRKKEREREREKERHKQTCVKQGGR